jgi:hypothetical protein
MQCSLPFLTNQTFLISLYRQWQSMWLNLSTMLTRTQTFKKSIHLCCCAQHGKDVVEELLEKWRNKKRNEEDSTAASSLHPILTAIQREDKQVTNFMTVTICTVRFYQACCFLMLNTRLSCFNQLVSNDSYFSVSSSGGTTIRGVSQSNHAIWSSFTEGKHSIQIRSIDIGNNRSCRLCKAS